MAKTLEAHDKLIKDLFDGSYQFEIPDYQRPYAWTTEQTEELFNDLVAALQEAPISTDSKQYFLGSIVLIKEDRAAKAMVVDGQQRLTTLTILFAAFLAIWEEEHYLSGVNSVKRFLLEEGDEMLGKANGYRFAAREEDTQFFRHYIQEQDGILKLINTKTPLEDSQQRYKENASLLMEKLKNLEPEDRKNLWKFLANDCSLVVISTPNLDAAYRIFSVLNNRGLDLAPIDILKAEVLGAIRKDAGEEASRRYARKWSDIETTLGREAFSNLFVHIRSIYAKQKQRKLLVKEFPQYVIEYRTPIDLIDTVIEPYAQVWAYVSDANFETTEQAEEINHCLFWLNQVDFKDWVPPALIYFKRFRQTPGLLANYLKLLERLTYFLLVTKAGINERIETYASLLKEIEPDGFNGDVEVLNTLKLSDTQKHDFIQAIDGDIYRRLPKACTALILRLEALMSDGSKKQVFEQVSIEHVLPQTPASDSEWLQWFPTREVRELWTHRLANLVPLHRRKNPAAGRYNFETKKDVYFKGKGTASPFVLTQDVRAETLWTPDLLAVRQKRLLKTLSRHWDLLN